MPKKDRSAFWGRGCGENVHHLETVVVEYNNPGAGLWCCRHGVMVVGVKASRGVAALRVGGALGSHPCVALSSPPVLWSPRLVTHTRPSRRFVHIGDSRKKI